MNPAKPWCAAAWTPNPGGKPTDGKYLACPNAHKAAMWARTQRQRGRRAVIWHVSVLPPAEVREVFPDLQTAS